MTTSKRHIWTPDEIELLRQLYPTHSSAERAARIGVSERAVFYKTKSLGLRKSIEWIRDRARMRTSSPDHPDRCTQFRKGLTPWNKGIPFDSGGASHTTRFQPERKPHLWRPIGHTRTRSDGYRERKTADTGVTRRDYVLLHHLVWRLHGHSVPAGNALVFRDGNNRNFDINNLELVSRTELMRRNSVHRLPKDVARAVQLLGALKRQINNRQEKTA